MAGKDIIKQPWTYTRFDLLSHYMYVNNVMKIFSFMVSAWRNGQGRHGARNKPVSSRAHWAAFQNMYGTGKACIEDLGGQVFHYPGIAVGILAWQPPKRFALSDFHPTGRPWSS
jgi:hypothetical protein